MYELFGRALMNRLNIEELLCNSSTDKLIKPNLGCIYISIIPTSFWDAGLYFYNAIYFIGKHVVGDWVGWV